MQISYKMMSNAHVHQLTVPLTMLISFLNTLYLKPLSQSVSWCPVVLILSFVHT